MNESPVVCVTGGTRGLGLAMVKQLVKHGARVAACGRDPDAVAALAKQFGADHWWQAVDVTDGAQVDQFAASTVERLGPPDFLINNAGVINRNARLWEVPADEFSRVIDVNVKGVANMIRSFAPAMIERGTGVFVNFSSGWGRSTAPEVAPYCASKYAIEGLSEAFAQELPSGMASVALNPGIINTDMLQSCFGAGAGSYPTATQWAETAVPFILRLSFRDNGRSLTAP